MKKYKKSELNKKIAIFSGRLVNESAQGTMGYDLLFRETSEQLTAIWNRPKDCPDGRRITLTDMKKGIIYEENVKNELYVGRANSYQHSEFLMINEADISRTHCRLFLYRDSIYIEDLGSSNHTCVNDVRIVQPVELNNGDIVGLGRNRYQIQIRTSQKP